MFIHVIIIVSDNQYTDFDFFLLLCIQQMYISREMVLVSIRNDPQISNDIVSAIDRSNIIDLTHSKRALCFHAYLFDIESTLVDMQLVSFFFWYSLFRYRFDGNLSHPKLTKTVADKCGSELYFLLFSAKNFTSLYCVI